MVYVDSAGITDVGRKRDKNEDSMLIDLNCNLFVVADGVGGHRAGEVASNLAIQTIKDYIEKNSKKNMPVDVFDADDVVFDDANLLVSSIKAANSEVYNRSTANESLKGMASTLSAVLVSDEMIFTANVGDSPIYLVSNGEIELVSVAHTLSNEQKKISDASDQAIEIDESSKNMLTRCIGIKETVKVDFCELPYIKGDQLIICSDGLSGKVSEKEIFNIVTCHNTEKACRLLVDLANERGGDDNITVIILKIKKGFISINLSRAVKKIRNFFHKLI